MLTFQEFSEKMKAILQGLQDLTARSEALDQRTLRLEERIISDEQQEELRKKIQQTS